MVTSCDEGVPIGRRASWLRSAYTQALPAAEGGGNRAAPIACARKNSQVAKIRLAGRGGRTSKPAHRRRPGSRPTRLRGSCSPSRRSYGKILAGDIALKAGDARQAIRGIDRRQRHPRHLARPLSTWAAPTSRRRLHAKPTRDSTAASAAAAKRSRCSWTKAYASGLFPPVCYYQGRAPGLNNAAGYGESASNPSGHSRRTRKTIRCCPMAPARREAAHRAGSATSALC